MSEICFEFLKFAACTIQERYGIHCPYAHSIYEMRKFVFDHRLEEQPGFINRWALNSDEPIPNRQVRLAD